jgi:hypothetical protein
MENPNEEVTIIESHAKVIYVRHPQYSYGIFCFNKDGDLFLNSDWGMYGFAWRSFGKDFEEFLARVNSDYVYGKFETNHRYLNRKDLPKHTRKPVCALIDEFVKVMKSQVQKAC